MNLREVLPVVSLVAEFADPADEAYKYLYFSGGSACATSGRHGAVFECSVDLDGVATPAVPFARLLKALKGGGEDEVEITCTDRQVAVRSGKFRAHLPLLRSEDASHVAREAPKGKVGLAPEFWDVLRLALPTVGPATGKSEFHGVYWSNDGTLVSTDALRITSVSSGVPCPFTGGLLVPMGFLKAAGSGWGAAGVDDRGCLWFLTKGGGVWTGVGVGTFPSVASEQLLQACRKRIGDGGGTLIEVDPARASRIIDRLLLSAAAAPWRMVVTAGDGELTLSVPESDGLASLSEETIQAKVDGPPCTIIVNGRFLSYALEYFSLMHVQDPRTPIYFRNEDGAEHLVVPLFS